MTQEPLIKSFNIKHNIKKLVFNLKNTKLLIIYFLVIT